MTTTAGCDFNHSGSKIYRIPKYDHKQYFNNIAIIRWMSYKKSIQLTLINDHYIYGTPGYGKFTLEPGITLLPLFTWCIPISYY